MVKIHIRDNYYTLVDDADAPKLQGKKLYLTTRGCADFYLNGKKESVHRYILGLKHGDKKIVYHINGNRLDNRRSNLGVTDATSRYLMLKQAFQNKKLNKDANKNERNF